MKKFQLSKNTTEKNTKCVDAVISAVQEMQENLTTARQEFLDNTTKPGQKLASIRVDKLEEDSGAQMTELRRTQDALRKAKEARKTLLQREVESELNSDCDDSTC